MTTPDLSFADAKRLQAQQKMWAAQHYARKALGTGSTLLARLYRDKAETARMEAAALIQQSLGWDKEAA